MRELAAATIGALAIASVVWSPIAYAKPPGSGIEPAYVPGYVLVSPRPGLPPSAFKGLLAAHGGNAVGRVGKLNVYVVDLAQTGGEKAIAQALSKNPNIKFAEPDALVASSFVPNDAYYTSEWHLQTIGAPSAWNFATGNGVTVAILDSGIDPTHPDLATQLVPGWDFYDNSSNTADVYGHGTMVAGVVAAIGNNGIGVSGVAFNARLMPIRVTDTNGYASISALASGLSYAADHGARVANMSFAVQSYSTIISAAQYFMSKGGVVVNSAGNYGTLDSTAPSGALVSVSATGSTDAIASWSSYGPYVDVSAPGVSIWTTTMGGSYGAVSGTSFSSPITAGVVALMMSANPNLAPTQIVSMLESTAVDLGTAGYDYYYGYGRVNAASAVLAAAEGAASDTQVPSASITSPTGGTVSGIVAVNVSASDNVGVTHVDLYVNGGLLASDTVAPYGFSWDSSALAGTSATLVAKAYDAAGNVGASKQVTVSVVSAAPPDTTPPTVSIASPTGGSVSGVVPVSVNATDNVGVTRVDLLVNGAVVASDTTAPYTFTWDSSARIGTNVTLVATAYDAAGNSASSQAVTVSVTSAAAPSNPDATPPSVTISNPPPGSTVSGIVSVSASANDNVAVASISLAIDGSTVATTNSASISYRWNTKKVSKGTHTISATARDTSGNQSTTTIQVRR
ncbi:MAG TPA: S8 family serine peptidase [Candidatus Tumulicola sp.]|nr:S8 family serine peptidase [Candidatus Tumulicola sp.]